MIVVVCAGEAGGAGPAWDGTVVVVSAGGLASPGAPPITVRVTWKGE